MKLSRRLVALLIVLVAGSSACTVGRPSPHASPMAHPSSTSSVTSAADAQRCARLASRGFTPCPPRADQLTLPATTIRNATNGAVPDATAQQWGKAFQLAQAYYYWAMQDNARGALTSGVLADANPNAVGNLFGSDLMDLDDARQDGGVLVYQPPLTPTVQVVSVPSDLKAAMQRQGLKSATYAVAVQFKGPTRRAIRLPKGTEQVIVAHDARFVADVLVWGQVVNDPDLGAIWYEFGNYGCDGAVRGVCQL